MKLEHIAVATDFSEPSERALEIAAKLARSLPARLSLVHVYNPIPLGPAAFYPAHVWSGSDLGAQLKQTAEKELRRLRKEGALAEVKTVEIHAIANASPALAMSDFAQEKSVDMVVVGTHGRSGLSHVLIGSVAENIMRHAPCPVLAVRPSVEVADFPKHIVVATDFSPNAGPGLDWAGDLSQRFGSRLTVVHVYDVTPWMAGIERIEMEPFERVDAELKTALEELHMERFGGRRDVRTELLVASSPADALSRYAEAHEVDLMVLTTHGRTGIKRLFMGSVAEKVVRHAPCAVLAARTPS